MSGETALPKKRPVVSDKTLLKRAVAAEKKLSRMKERKRAKAERRRIERERNKHFSAVLEMTEDIKFLSGTGVRE